MVGFISSQTSVTGIEILFLIATVPKKRRGAGEGRARGEVDCVNYRHPSLTSLKVLINYRHFLA